MKNTHHSFLKSKVTEGPKTDIKFTITWQDEAAETVEKLELLNLAFCLKGYLNDSSIIKIVAD